MSGIKGFSIVTIIFLLLAVLFLSVGNTEEMNDEQFEKEYNKTLIGEIDYPVVMPCVVKRDGQDPMYEWVEKSFLMADVHRNKVLIFFSYYEDNIETAPIESIFLNDKKIDFLQDDEAIENEGKSFVVIPIVGSEFAKNDDISVVVFYGENKLSLNHRFFVISDRHLDNIFQMVVEMVKEYKESEIKL